MRDTSTGLLHCDRGGCSATTPTASAARGWSTLGRFHYCPAHPVKNDLDAGPLNPDTLSDLALDLVNRCRCNGGLPPLSRTLV